ncbi:uncharacterized protein LOC119970480 isoform X1 [Scyliorhinus canicula]|uniref:uncharacterized protein LOC119970480 isoform X1 n=1 Tax=Scyliorhinus canicula TaxID=7830 RepID=UPI0018F44FF2|nr:uncharacterized protein LOC119970480 isoform X1 [Scyliorhinus canicula]
MADGFKSRLFDILKPSSWNFQNLTFPWRFSNDRLSQVQLKEYQELTFLTKHEIIRAESVTQGEGNGREVRKGRPKSYPSSSNKIRNKKRRTSTSITSTNEAIKCKEAQQKVEVEMDKEIQTLASQLSRSKLEGIFVRLAKRNPGLIIDLLQDAPSNYYPHGPSTEVPNWCVCGFCWEMPTDIEKVCCGKTEQYCISKSCAMANLCLNEAVLHLMLIYRNELFGLHSLPAENYNRELRHAAYRQYIMWQHGCLGDNNKRIIPSCCVWIIRTTFPDPDGEYSGFQASRLS